jgi:hypothetical protein
MRDVSPLHVGLRGLAPSSAGKVLYMGRSRIGWRRSLYSLQVEKDSFVNTLRINYFIHEMQLYKTYHVAQRSLLCS